MLMTSPIQFNRLYSVDALNLPIESRRYKFQCLLPQTLPSSIEHSVGYIAYEVCVFVGTTTWSYEEFKERFIVIKDLDLSIDQLLQVSDFVRLIFEGET